MFNNTVHDIISTIDDLEGPDEFQANLIRLKSEMGFDHIAYLAVDVPSASLKEPYTICTYGNEWFNFYFENDCLNSDPIVRYSQNSYKPYQWQDIKKSKKEKEFMSLASEFGIAEKGVTIPIRRLDGEYAMLCVNANVTHKGWKDLMAESFPIVRMFADYYHNCFVNNIIASQEETQKIHLTEREKECLLWTARGKSNWEIANILNVSERTVTYHVGNACEKMGVYSRFHAVVMAISEKLIHP